MPTNYLKHPGPPNGSEVWEVGQSCIDTYGKATGLIAVPTV